MKLWPFLLNTVLVLSAAIGLPALLLILWHRIRRSPAGEGLSLAEQVSRVILMAFGSLFVLAAIVVPIILSRTVPLRDEELLRVAPGFTRFEFAYTSLFSGDMADFRADPQGDQVCLRFSSARRDQGYGGWMIVLWQTFLAKFFKDQGYPEKGRDLSRFGELSFQLRADREDAILEVALKDTKGVEPRIPLPRRDLGEKITTGFTPFSIDLRKGFQAKEPSLDLFSIETISFAVNAPQVVTARKEPLAESEPVSQTVCIQDIQLR